MEFIKAGIWKYAELKITQKMRLITWFDVTGHLGFHASFVSDSYIS